MLMVTESHAMTLSQQLAGLGLLVAMSLAVIALASAEHLWDRWRRSSRNATNRLKLPGGSISVVPQHFEVSDLAASGVVELMGHRPSLCHELSLEAASDDGLTFEHATSSALSHEPVSPASSATPCCCSFSISHHSL